MRTAFILAASLIAGTAQASGPQTVVIDNFNFQPNVITVVPGTHVVFKNQDDLPHTVVVPGMKIKSPIMDTDGTYEATFDQPGDFKYFCGVHPMMTGEVIVKAE
jgi:plastocyanin